MNDKLFDVIRHYSKYCSICGNNLCLKFTDWHFPFCMKCRAKVFPLIVAEQHKQIEKDIKKFDRKVW